MLSTLAKPTIVLLIPDTVPIKVGEAKGAFKANELVTSVVLAFKSKAASCAELTGLFTSLVLSTFAKSTIVFVIPLTVPVNVGDAKGAFKVKLGTVGDVALPPKSPVN